MDKYFVDHTLGVYPASADGVPFDAKYLASKGDAIADYLALRGGKDRCGGDGVSQCRSLT